LAPSIFGGPEIVKQFSDHPVMMSSVMGYDHGIDDVNGTGFLYTIYRLTAYLLER